MDVTELTVLLPVAAFVALAAGVLVVLRRALGLPLGSALVLFALGRTAGWIAHVLEQFADNRLIRPRAHYTGHAPRAFAAVS